jgi:hypothetical protein
MKTILLFFAFAGIILAQNPKPCTNVQNSAASGQVLSAATAGATPQCKWITGGGGGTPGGANTQIQFNDSASFGGNAKFTVNKTTGAFTLNKLGCTGSAPFTCTFYDDTAVTGASKMALRVGASQTNHTTCTDRLWTTFDNNGTDVLSEIDCAGSFAVNDWNNAFKKKVGMASNITGAGGPSGIGLASDAMIISKSVDNLDSAGSYDVGLCRGLAGTYYVNNGTSTCTPTGALGAASMSTGTSAPTCTAGTGGPICLHEGTAVTGEANADNCYGDSTDHDIKCSFNNGTIAPLARGPSSATTTGNCVKFADTKGSNLLDSGAPCGTGGGGAGFSGSVSLGTGAISSGTCATVVTSTQTGMAGTDTLAWTFNADPTGVTGYSPTTNGMLTIIAYPTTNTANFKICNNTNASVTPGAITLNFAAGRGAIASGTSALGTGAIGSGACATAVTTAATGAATTSTIAASFNGDPTAVTGYSPTTNGMLTVIGYPTSGNVNWKVCNNTTASITPGAITLNWRVF